MNAITNFCNFCAVRDGDTVKHYRIRQLDEGGFFIARRTTFRNLQDLVEHYSKDADGLCVNLCKPCVQVSRPATSCLAPSANDDDLRLLLFLLSLLLLLLYLCGLTLSEWSLDSLLCMRPKYYYYTVVLCHTVVK